MIEQVFGSSGVNPRSHCLCVSESNHIVYASGLNLVVEAFPEASNESGYVTHIGDQCHEKPISVVKRLRSVNHDFFISGGVDGIVNLWSVKGGRLELVKFIDRCNAPIVSVCGTVLGDRIVLIACWAGETCGVTSWWFNPNFELMGTSMFDRDSRVFPLAADCQTLPVDRLLVCIGNSQRQIEFHAEAEHTFVPVLSIVGHSDWIHSVGFNANSNKLLLASAGQDTYVKLWNISTDVECDDSEELSVTKNKFTVAGGSKDIHLNVNVESVLAGHEDWVHSTNWSFDGTQLITSSSDKTTIVWKEENGLWFDSVRLGIVGGQAAGFFAACFSHNSDRVVASSYFGGLNAWQRGSLGSDPWIPLAMSGGHVGEVRDVCWDPTGSYLLSVGKDQTTRIYARSIHNQRFFEIARPQVHGHDMQCLVSVSPSCFVSGGEEKIFRAFQAPQSFADSLVNLAGINKEKIFGTCSLADFGARVPALGLSNKAIDAGDDVKEEEKHWEEGAFQAKPVILSGAPTEDSLQQNTLWPELHKMYGHGFEVYAIASDPSGKVVATSCKASQTEHASLILWNVDDWSKQATLLGHQLTVTEISWSPNGKYILSVSRDRTAILYKQSDKGNIFSYIKVWSSSKEHTRIIWSCCWADDSSYFFTASRDMKVILWKLNEEGGVSILQKKFDKAVTAVTVGSHQNRDKLVCGFQDGSICFLNWGVDGLNVIDSFIMPAKPADIGVTRLRFSPSGDLLAYAGANGQIRVFSC